MLRVTDLVFNVSVMPFYVDTFLHRRWRFTGAVCRWHTFFGATVIVSSSLHIVCSAPSRPRDWPGRTSNYFMRRVGRKALTQLIS